MVWTCDRLTGGLGLTVERKRNISINREANDTTGGWRLIPNHIFHPVDRSNNETQTARIIFWFVADCLHLREINVASTAPMDLCFAIYNL